jgi:hypothetical protein
MAICGCCLPAHCCQPAVAGGFIYADFWGKLSTHLALQACLLRVLCIMPLLQAFPFPSTLGEVTLHLLSQAGVFIYISCGKWAFSPLLWSFPPTATFASFPTPDCWVCAAAPAFSVPACLFTAHMGSGPFPVSSGVFLPPPLLQAFSLLFAGYVLPLLPSPAWLVYLQFCKGFPSPTLQHSVCPTLFATCLYCCYCLLLSFLFSLGGGWSVQGAMLIWPRVVCGSTVYHLAHLVVCVFPSRLGTGIWWRPKGPPCFSI